MGALNVAALPRHALLLVDAAPIIYVVEGSEPFATHFTPVFAAHSQGQIRLAVTTLGLAEVMVGALRNGQELLATRYRTLLESWQVVPLDTEIAVSAARLRAAHKLQLTDAVHAASSIAIGAYALLTYDRDFSRVPGLRVLG
jgi:predicted nucleic acid-binding protein